MPYVPYQLSVSNAPPNFQGQGASSSNNQGKSRTSFFEEIILYLLNEMKKNNDSQIVNLEMTQVNMGASLKNLKTQMGKLAHSTKESSSRSFPSDTEKNPKDCMAITLRSEKDLEDEKGLGNSKKCCKWED